MATHNSYITPKLFRFFRDLKRNNDRDWFAANRSRYEDDVRGPLLAFIDDFAEPLDKISPHYRAEAKKAGGSLFRIFRDVRFSKDKTPYKTHAGVHFRHENARDAHAPGFYLHLDPAQVFMGVGIWHPERVVATKIRQAIVDDPEAWQKALRSAPFRRGGFRLEGESYKRPPPEFDRQHPLITDLMRKDFIAVRDLSEEEVCAPDFPRLFAARCKSTSAFMKFLTEAVGLPY